MFKFLRLGEVFTEYQSPHPLGSGRVGGETVLIKIIRAFELRQGTGRSSYSAGRLSTYMLVARLNWTSEDGTVSSPPAEFSLVHGFLRNLDRLLPRLHFVSP